MPLSFRGIDIKNFRGIQSASVEGMAPEAPWIFLTGNNGYGKSCLLQAIFLGFWGQNQDESTILEKAPFEIQFSGYEGGDTFAQSVDQKTMSGGRQETFSIVAYGPSRLELQGMSTNEEQQKSTTSYSIFNPDGLLLNIEAALKDWYIRSTSKELEKRDANFLRKRYDGVVEALVELMPNIAEISTDVKENKVYYTEKDAFNNVLPGNRTLSQIASGSKSILAMIGDLMIRLFRKQPDVVSPSELEGVAIIDEIDLHLHPKWQKVLPQLLSKVFPKVQFIASTHSPIPFLGAPEGSLFLTVDRSPEEGVVIKKLEMDVSDFTPNLILSSPIFGFSEVFPITHDDKDRIRTEDTYAGKKLNDQIEQRLKDYKGSEKEQELLKIFASQKGK